MNTIQRPQKSSPHGSLATVLGAALFALATAVSAHDFKLGSLRIDHPYATPTAPVAKTAATYIRTLSNTGDVPDRLISASTPVAERVEIHRSVIDSHNVMRMRAIEAVELPAKSEQKLRHGGELHLMLINLKAPLKDGDSFPMTLRFEKAGEREVTVQVQRPRDGAGSHEHKH